MSSRAKKLWGESSSETSDSEESLQAPPKTIHRFSDDDGDSLSQSDADSQSSIEMPVENVKKVTPSARSQIVASKSPVGDVTTLDKDTMLQELQREINVDFFKPTGFNPMKYYQNQSELREQSQLINDAVGRLVERSYLGFTQATSSFRDVLHTFTTAQMAVRVQKENFAESKSILGSSTDNVEALHLKYAVQDNVVRIFQKAEVVNDAHAHIKAALHHNQYQRAALILTNAISVLSSQDQRDIASLITVRESLIALRHELERKLTEGLQSQLFLKDNRQRQSVLDGSFTRTASFHGSASEVRNPYSAGTGYCQLRPNSPATLSTKARQNIDHSLRRLNTMPTEVFQSPSTETILGSLPFSPGLVGIRDNSVGDLIGPGKLFEPFSKDAQSAAQEIQAMSSHNQAMNMIKDGKLTPLPQSERPAVSLTGSPVRASLLSPGTNKETCTRRYHKLYHYKLMHIENSPSYISDPLAHPEEHAIILVEALHVLQALPGAQTRLQKGFEKNLSELTEREVKFAVQTHKKLKLTTADVGAEEDTHNSAVTTGDALVGLLPMRVDNKDNSHRGTSEVDFAHEVLSVVLILHTHVQATCKNILGHTAWVLNCGMLSDSHPQTYYLKTLQEWETKQNAVDLHRQLLPLALASQTAVQKQFFTLLNRPQAAPLLASSEVKTPQPTVKPVGKKDVALQAPKISFGLSQGALASFSWDRLVNNLATGQKQTKTVIQHPASNLAVPPKHSAALAMRACDTLLGFSAAVTLLVDGHFTVRYLPLPPFLSMFYEIRKEKNATVVPLPFQTNIAQPKILSYFQSELSSTAACYPLVTALRNTEEGFIHPRTSQIYINASTALASMHDCLSILETNVVFTISTIAPQSALLQLVKHVYNQHNLQLHMKQPQPKHLKVIAQSGMLCRYITPIAAALKSTVEDCRYVATTTAHLTADSLTQLVDLAINSTKDITQRFLADRAAFQTLQASNDVAREMSEDPWFLCLRQATQHVQEPDCVENFSALDNPVLQALMKRTNASILSDRTDGTGIVAVALMSASLEWLSNYLYLLPFPLSNQIPCLGGFSENGQYVADIPVLQSSMTDTEKEPPTTNTIQDKTLKECISYNLEACIAYARLSGTFNEARSYATEETVARRTIAVDASHGAAAIRNRLSLDADVRKERIYNWLTVVNPADSLLSDVRWLLASELLKASDLYLHTVKFDLLIRISKSLSSLRLSVTLDTTVSVDTYAPVSVNSKAMQWAFLCAEYIHSVITSISNVWSATKVRYLMGGVADIVDTLIRHYCGLCIEQAGDQLPQILRKGVGIIQQTITSLWPKCEHLDILGEHQAFHYESFKHVEEKFEKTKTYAHLLTLSYEEIISFQQKNPNFFDNDSFASAIKYAKRA